MASNEVVDEEPLWIFKSVLLTSRLRAALFFVGVYYVLGVVTYILIERPAEIRMYADNRALYAHMKAMYKFEYCEDEDFQSLSFCESQQKMDAALREYFNTHGPNSLEDKGQWTVVGTIFFLTHVATTIGYGHSQPSTPPGKLVTILFSVVGLPLMAYLLAIVGEMHLAHSQAILAKVYGSGQIDGETSPGQRRMKILWALLIAFLFAGALVYRLLEPTWSFLECLYFCFITLSTIGFGDYLPSSIYSRIFSIFYMILGLGVCASLIGALAGLVSESQNELLLNLKKRMSGTGNDMANGAAGTEQEEQREMLRGRP